MTKSSLNTRRRKPNEHEVIEEKGRNEGEWSEAIIQRSASVKSALFDIQYELRDNMLFAAWQGMAGPDVNTGEKVESKRVYERGKQRRVAGAARQEKREGCIRVRSYRG